MTPEAIVTKFANVLEKFEPIDVQLYNTGITRIREVVAPLLLQILYDEMGGTHNLIGLVWPVSVYTTRYVVAFVEPTLVGAYDVMIDRDATAVVCARTESSKTHGCGNSDTRRKYIRMSRQSCF